MKKKKMNISYVPGTKPCFIITYNTASFYSIASFVLAKDVLREISRIGTKSEEKPVLGKAT